jgi:antitoxin component YwqK of YwqJK toxin-antitoxin module
MNRGGPLSLQTRMVILLALATALCLPAPAQTSSVAGLLQVQAAGFTLATNDAVSDGAKKIALSLASGQAPLPFCQSAVKQSTAPALQGPEPNIPYFIVRFALPIPPENATSNVAALAGIDPMVFTHNHSPGFEILPNGDALAVYFSTPPGESESATTTAFVQARLRYGSEEWDLPELFFKTQNYNDQSGLLWNDDGTIRFFGGGRGLSDRVPFKMAVSTDNGATWTLSLPQLDQPAEDFTAQPITSAFRGQDDVIYFAMDGAKAMSFLWRSTDNGIHWHDMGGRTGGRHSAIVPLDDKGDLLSIGGKNSSVNGWSPESGSTNWGASWSKSVASSFPPLGSGQRPSLIRLADGNLFFVSDAFLNKAGRAPPDGWKFGNGCFVAISTNNGASWRIKPLPVQLPNHEHGTNGTLGYVTARQAPNGVIHILTTETQPCLHYELNEAWIFSNAGDIAPETSGGKIRKFSENYPNGKLRSRWSARICPNGRYLLDGTETDFYANGAKQYEVTYASGRKTGEETFWSPDGKQLWRWSHELKTGNSVWIQYWPNDQKKVQSFWKTRPFARDLHHTFFGFVADGPSRHWDENGKLVHEYWFNYGDFAGGD